MRLNWFLPPGKTSTNGHGKTHAEHGSVADGGVVTETRPARTANHLGGLRGLLKVLGPTWSASPVRRLIQTGFFVLFLGMFFYMLRPAGTAGGVDARNPAGTELFLILDPLVTVSTAIASRTWVWSLPAAGIILAVSLIIPRSFCSYICPMGTLIDLSDWGINKRLSRWGLKGRGWWVHLKYYILTSIVVAALFGVLVSGFFSAIPVVTRGMAFLLAPLQTGLMTGWHTVPPMHGGHYLSIALFVIVLALGLLGPRFWCRYVCPTGALFSLANFLRLTQRNVEVTCGQCGQCRKVCPFDAVNEDFSTRTADCAFCQTCGGVCPKRAVQFAPRWKRLDLKPADAAQNCQVALSRRGFLLAAAASGAVVVGTRKTALGAQLGKMPGYLPVRPPGSVPEREFLQMCIRCQECTKACPTGLLQPLGFQQGIEGLWTVYANTDWAGCDPNCNRCGEACPTKAIHALPLEQKKHIRMGLSIVDEKICLPHAGREACQLCYDACHHAGHDAIEFVRVGVKTDETGAPIEDTGFLAPMVVEDLCVGCGMCQSRCYGVNVGDKHLLSRAAIRVQAGEGKEDRPPAGSPWFKPRDIRRGHAGQHSEPTIQAPGAGVPQGAAPVQPAPTTAPACATQPSPVGVDLPDFMN